MAKLLDASTGENDFQRMSYIRRLDESIEKGMNRVSHYVNKDIGNTCLKLANYYRSLPQEYRYGIVYHPFFSYFWVRTMELIAFKKFADLEQWVSQFGRHLVIPLLRNNLWDDSLLISVPVYRGVIRFPGHHIHISVLNDNNEVHLKKYDASILIDGGDERFYIEINDLLRGNSEDERINSGILLQNEMELDSSDMLVHMLFDKMNHSGRFDEYGKDLMPFSVINEKTYANINESCRLIRELWPEMWTEISSYVRTIIPYTSEKSSSFTQANYMGAVFISEAKHPFESTMFTAEHILHEHSHLRLTLMIADDHLIWSDDPKQVFYSPFKPYPRPLLWILHGAYVFSRMAIFLSRGFEAGLGEKWRVRLNEVIDKVNESIIVLEQYGNTSELGQQLLCEMKSLVKLHTTSSS